MYSFGYLLVGALSFLAAWVYAIDTYGFFIGVGLGWLPSAAIGHIAGLLWPLLALAGIVVTAAALAGA